MGRSNYIAGLRIPLTKSPTGLMVLIPSTSQVASPILNRVTKSYEPPSRLWGAVCAAGRSREERHDERAEDSCDAFCSGPIASDLLPAFRCQKQDPRHKGIHSKHDL